MPTVLTQNDRRARRSTIIRLGVAAVFVVSMVACSERVDSASTTTAVPMDPVASTASTASTTSVVAVPPTTVPLGGINGSALEDRLGRGVVMVIARPCDGFGYGRGSGFAIDSRTIVTNWHVVAEDSEVADSPIDPRPWIMTYNRAWRRGTVIGASQKPDVAVIRLDEGEPDFTQPLRWSDTPPADGQNLAVLGFPGIESGEFNLVVAEATDVDGQNRGIPSFGLTRRLSGRTGPGNSGGPIVDADGAVVGIHTWGTFDRSHWFAQDTATIRDAVARMTADPSEPVPSCPADGEDRYPLSYVVRLGTSADPSEEKERYDVVRDAGPAGALVISVNSDEWVPFLLSDYPFVLMAGPFATRTDAEAAVPLYQAAVDASGQVDRLSVGVFPTAAFDRGEATDEPAACIAPTDRFVVVHGVTPAAPLKLRAEPTTDADVIGTMENGEELMVSADDPVEAKGLTWIRVSTLDDTEPRCGWVAQAYTQALQSDH